jgi:hypothetical protein
MFTESVTFVVLSMLVLGIVEYTGLLSRGYTSGTVTVGSPTLKATCPLVLSTVNSELVGPKFDPRACIVPPAYDDDILWMFLCSANIKKHQPQTNNLLNLQFESDCIVIILVPFKMCATLDPLISTFQFFVLIIFGNQV